MKLLIIRAYSFFVARRIHKWSRNPIARQKKLLREILYKTRNTQYRKELGLEDISNYEEFRAKTPLQNYELLKKFVDRITKGESNVLSKDKPAYLVMTSGTTSGKKYIPVTKRGLGYYLRGGGDSIFYYIHVHRKYHLFSGKILPFTGTPRLDRIGQILSGRVSSLFNHQHTRLYKWFDRQFRLPSAKTNATPAWEDKVDAIIEETLGQDVRVIVGLPIWIQNFFDGILANGYSNVLEAFPNLELFIHGGMSIKPYQKHLDKLIHPERNIDYVEVYNASEGFFAFQNDVEDESLLLHLGSGLFYEFIPLHSHEDGQLTRLPLWKVKEGEEYELVISTISGVLAYQTGDTVRITSTYPFKITWTGRTVHFTSAFNEHVIAEEVEMAVQQAVEKTGMEVVEFSVAPRVDLENDTARYDWYIEFANDWDASKMTPFSHELDAYIKSKNHLYRELRHANILKPPFIYRMAKNSFFSYMKKQGKLGDQYKVIHLSNDRKIANELSEWVMS